MLFVSNVKGILNWHAYICWLVERLGNLRRMRDKTQVLSWTFVNFYLFLTKNRGENKGWN